MKTNIKFAMLAAFLCAALFVKGQNPLITKQHIPENIPYGKKLPPPAFFTEWQKNRYHHPLYEKFNGLFQYKLFAKNMNNYGTMLSSIQNDHEVHTMGANASPTSNFHLTKDINTLSESFPSNPVLNIDGNHQAFAVLNNITYFTADDGIHGSELWRSDGTAAGTYLLKDINGGESSSFISQITPANGKIFFSAYTDNNGQEPWVSDGTPAGTYLLADVNPGVLNSNPFEFVNVNGTVFFAVDGQGATSALWTTDGTSAGTHLVKDLQATDNANTILESAAATGLLFFTANSDAGKELWRSDGTSVGTYLVKDINPNGDSDPQQLTEFNHKLYFSADDGTGRKLWMSDGTKAGTTYALSDNTPIIPGDFFPNFNTPFTIIGNTMFLWASTDATGSELYKFNPAIETNIELVKNITPGSDGTGFDFHEMVNVNNTLYFQVFGNDGRVQLWKSNGEASGTQQVKSFSSAESFFNLTNGYGTVYFFKYDTTYGWEVWKSDGTAAGTVIVKDINPQDRDSNPAYLTACNKKLFFSAIHLFDGDELWLTDGSNAGTVQVKNINTTTTSSSNIDENYIAITALGNGVIFSAFEPVYGGELYKSDGTAAGTNLLDDIISGFHNSNPAFFVTKGNQSGFLAGTPSPGIGGIYRTDGTKSGTMQISQWDFSTYFFVEQATADNGLLFYVLWNHINNTFELWRSNGTAAGTYLLGTNLYNNGNFTAGLTTLGNNAYFVAGDDAHGYELWTSNGTVAGTKMLKDINPGTGGSYPYSLFVYNKAIYFGAFDGTSSNSSLWKTDGTDAGTIKLARIQPQYTYNIFGVKNLGDVYCVSNNTLFFSATDLDNGINGELWKTNGTSTGTKLVSNDNPPYGGNPNYLTDVNGVLYFTDYNDATGSELWKSDGTTSGTKLVKDITPGPDGSNINYLCSVNGKLYFAKDGFLWSSNGNAANTKQVLTGVSNVKNLIGVGSKLFFDGYTYQYGTELWEGDDNIQSFAAVSSIGISAATIKTTTFDATLYPNPVHNTAAIQIKGNTKNITVMIVDMSGRKVLQNNFSDKEQVNLLTEKLSAGTYFITVKNGIESKTLKMLKQ